MSTPASQPAHVAIAIDGPAASGKSTLARELAKRLGLVMVNSGEMYRAVTWKTLQAGIDPSNHTAVVELLRSLDLECSHDGMVSTIRINGESPGEALRSPEVNGHVSTIAAIPEVRECLIALQRSYLESCDVVMEGRDIGSVVFPDTPYKLYIDAAEEVRAARRKDAGEADSIAKRDAADSRRKTSPLVVAPGATVLDNSYHTIESGLEAVLEILRQQGLPLLHSTPPTPPQ